MVRTQTVPLPPTVAVLSARLTTVRLSLLLSLVLMGLAIAPAAAAALPCRTVNLADQSHEVCILKITRSAKQYWEYRASVRVDGETRPVESYDCRQRIRIGQDGKRIRIDQDAAGTLICQHFNR